MEFPPAPLTFGGRYVDVSQCTLLSTPAGSIRIITPTHSVMDRLIAAAIWQDTQSLEQATLVAAHQAESIAWREIDRWVRDEGIASTPQVGEFYQRIGRAGPSG